jgi:hypothetical protein
MPDAGGPLGRLRSAAAALGAAGLHRVLRLTARANPTQAGLAATTRALPAVAGYVQVASAVGRK